MLRILQRFILMMLLTSFASQASALFIQADWWDPTEPGVGTNRYAYSSNDPVNRLDPNGNRSFWEAVGDFFRSADERVRVNTERAQRTEARINTELQNLASGEIDYRRFDLRTNAAQRELESYQRIIEENGGSYVGIGVDVLLGGITEGGIGLGTPLRAAAGPTRTLATGGTAATTPLQARQLGQQLGAEELAGVRVPTTITGYTSHGAIQAASRDGVGVSTGAILRTFRNPSKIEHVPTQYGPSFRLTGPRAVVVVNPQGQIVTTWARGSLGVGGL